MYRSFKKFFHFYKGKPTARMDGLERIVVALINVQDLILLSQIITKWRETQLHKFKML